MVDQLPSNYNEAVAQTITQVRDTTLLGLPLQSCDRCVCHRVGDMIRFGLSTRLYLFGGPEDLRPAEGLSKLQKKQLAALEVCNSHCLSLLYGILNWGEAYLIPTWLMREQRLAHMKINQSMPLLLLI